MTEHQTCPKCSSARVVPIAYGEPTRETEGRARRGEVVLGGCLIGLGPDGDPEWACRDCGERFGRIDWEAFRKKASSKPKRRIPNKARQLLDRYEKARAAAQRHLDVVTHRQVRAPDAPIDSEYRRLVVQLVNRGFRAQLWVAHFREGTPWATESRLLEKLKNGLAACERYNAWAATHDPFLGHRPAEAGGPSGPDKEFVKLGRKGPKSAAEPREGGRPAYIDANCGTCGTPLVLCDSLRVPPTPAEGVWHDEWECPFCRDGMILDQPPGAYGRGAKGENDA